MLAERLIARDPDLKGVSRNFFNYQCGNVQSRVQTENVEKKLTYVQKQEHDFHRDLIISQPC